MKQVETFLETLEVRVDSYVESTLITERGSITKVNPNFHGNTDSITVISPEGGQEYVIEQMNIDESQLVARWAERFAELDQNVALFWDELTNGRLDPPKVRAKKIADKTPNEAYLSRLKDELEGATLAKKLEIFEELSEAHETSCIEYVRKTEKGVPDEELEYRCFNLEAGKSLAAVLIAEQLTK